MSLKCHDRETIPLCRSHHQAIERDLPPFKGWSKEGRFAWVDWQIAVTQAMYPGPTAPAKET